MKLPHSTQIMGYIEKKSGTHWDKAYEMISKTISQENQLKHKNFSPFINDRSNFLIITANFG